MEKKPYFFFFFFSLKKKMKKFQSFKKLIFKEVRMVSHKVFKKVLVEYFRYVLMEETGCGNECCFYAPREELWFDLKYLENYFDKSEIPRINHRYFIKIDEHIKGEIIERFPHLVSYFSENLWFKKHNATLSSDNNYPTTSNYKILKKTEFGRKYYKPTSVIYMQNSDSDSPSSSRSIFSSQNSPSGSRSVSPIRITGRYKRSPSIESFHSSPTGSRAISPTPIAIQKNLPLSSTESEASNIVIRKRYNLRQRQKRKVSKEATPPATAASEGGAGSAPRGTAQKRKYRKRLKLYSYLNQLPNNVRPLKPHESNLILLGLDGRQINDLNLPLPVCKQIRKQCQVLNPVTKRFTNYVDDNSENIPLNITLKY